MILNLTASDKLMLEAAEAVTCRVSPKYNTTDVSEMMPQPI